MAIIEFYQKYDIWAYVFSVISGLLAYVVIRLGEKVLFLIRTRRRIRHLNVDCSIGRDQSNYPCKLWIDFRNWTNVSLLMKIEGYKLPKEILPDPKATRDSTSGLLEIKFIEQAAQANKPPTLNIDSIIRHGENKKVWVPLESKQPDDMLNEALKNGKIGKLIATILWFGEKPRFTRYRPKIRRT